MAEALPDEPYVLDHIAFGVLDVAAVTPFLVGELGGRPFEAGPGIEFLWWQWQFARGGALEVLEPDGPPGGFIHRFLAARGPGIHHVTFIHRFLAARGPGIHHVTFKVTDLAVSTARVRSLGFEIVGYNDAFPSWKECFLHPKQAQGIVIQLAESHPELEPEWPHDVPFPKSPPAAAETTDVVGLRVSAISEERARYQWETVLGGACEATADGLCFRWPDSPLRVAVHVDPGAREGPLAIDLAEPLPRSLPDGPHPVLGVPFVAVGGDASSAPSSSP
jgi:methylmalonyl-CoA/ethylmalonyl-CoA epimerase